MQKKRIEVLKTIYKPKTKIINDNKKALDLLNKRS